MSSDSSWAWKTASAVVIVVIAASIWVNHTFDYQPVLFMDWLKGITTLEAFVYLVILRWVLVVLDVCLGLIITWIKG